MIEDKIVASAAAEASKLIKQVDVRLLELLNRIVYKFLKRDCLKAIFFPEESQCETPASIRLMNKDRGWSDVFSFFSGSRHSAYVPSNQPGDAEQTVPVRLLAGQQPQ